jgi:hypothetical protein
MLRQVRWLLAAGAALAVVVAACDRTTAPVTDDSVVDGASPAQFLAKKVEAVDPFSESHEIDPAAVARVTAMVDGLNATLKDRGINARLEYPWLFMLGRGTDPWNQLRTGSKWPSSPVSYVIKPRYTADLPVAVTDATLEAAYDTWSDVENTYIEAVRIADPFPGFNTDILDGTFDNGNCIDIVDRNADNIVFYDPNTGQIVFVPIADIVVGGFLGPEYFSECLGSEYIIGVTWFFAFGDSNGDHYADQLYVEQYYNDGFDWVTSGAQLLGTDMDLETITVHENGHTHGLGHFGGPLPRQQLILRPNGRIFTPEAVMNPIYFGGEKRDLYPTDLAALRTLYGGLNP